MIEKSIGPQRAAGAAGGIESVPGPTQGLTDAAQTYVRKVVESRFGTAQDRVYWQIVPRAARIVSDEAVTEYVRTVQEAVPLYLKSCDHCHGLSGDGDAFSAVFDSGATPVDEQPVLPRWR